MNELAITRWLKMTLAVRPVGIGFTGLPIGVNCIGGGVDPAFWLSSSKMPMQMALVSSAPYITLKLNLAGRRIEASPALAGAWLFTPARQYWKASVPELPFNLCLHRLLNAVQLVRSIPSLSAVLDSDGEEFREVDANPQSRIVSLFDDPHSACGRRVWGGIWGESVRRAGGPMHGCQTCDDHDLDIFECCCHCLAVRYTFEGLGT